MINNKTKLNMSDFFRSKREMIKKVNVVVGSFFTQFIIVGMLFTYGVLMTELEKEFGWSRTILSSIGAAGWLAWGILAIPRGLFK